MQKHDVVIIQERSSIGRCSEVRFQRDSKITKSAGPEIAEVDRIPSLPRARDFLTKLFLPSGYPNTVAPDYLRYQILNALQAFCSSLAGLLSSRAVLQGFGVGDPTATPNQALLLTIAQDVFSRLTTIVSAYYIGSALYPEAKSYRLLADVLNDIALILDTLSPFLHSLGIPGLRVAALCLSAAFRSLCGITAGGAKAAIAVHFTSPVDGKGDIGDLNAKDASKETVLALFGMLLGSWIVPGLSSAWETWSVFLILIACHLIINYVGVRGLALRTLNRQRTTLAWTAYRTPGGEGVAPSPSEVAHLEGIFNNPTVIQDVRTGYYLGDCAIGSSFSVILRQAPPSELIYLFQKERYVIWFDHRCFNGGADRNTLSRSPRVHICLKEGYTTQDQLKAWIHAIEVCSYVSTRGMAYDNMVNILRISYTRILSEFDAFLIKMEASGWNLQDSALLTGSPDALLLAVEFEREDKKSQ